MWNAPFLTREIQPGPFAFLFLNWCPAQLYAGTVSVIFYFSVCCVGEMEIARSIRYLGVTVPCVRWCFPGLYVYIIYIYIDCFGLSLSPTFSCAGASEVCMLRLAVVAGNPRLLPRGGKVACCLFCYIN